MAETIGDVESQSSLFAGTTFCPFTLPLALTSARADNSARTDVHRTDPESEKTDLKRSIATYGGTLIEKIPDPDKDRIVVSSAFSGERGILRFVHGKPQLSVFACAQDWRIAKARRTAMSSAPLGSKTASPPRAACHSAESKTFLTETRIGNER